MNLAFKPSLVGSTFSRLFEFVLIFQIVHGDQMNLQPFSFGGVTNKYNARMHRQSRLGSSVPYQQEQHKAGVKGHAIINGEYVETNRILLQRANPQGIAYYPYGKPEVPVFIRAQREANKKYIIFQDPYLPPGEGYLVVLKRFPIKVNPTTVVGSASVIPVPSEIPYEAFHLHLSNNIHGSFDRLNIRKFAYGIRTKFAERRKARQNWLNRRQFKARSSKRFSVAGAGRWRGKRSAGNISKNKSALDYYYRNDWNPCYISPMNVTRVRLMAFNDKSEFSAYDNFDYSLL